MKRLMEITKNVLRNGGLFVIILILTYKMVFAKIDFNYLIETLGNLNKGYLLLGVFTSIFMILAEGYVVKRNLRLLGEEKKFKNCFIYALAGNFFSAITPAATGGQPMQLYYMRKNDVSISKGTLALLMDLGAYQISIVSLGIVGYMAYFNRINESLGSFKLILWGGLLLNIILLIVTLIALFSKRFIYKLTEIIRKFVSIFSKKKGTEVEDKMMKEVKGFRACAEILKNNKKDYTINCGITFLRIIAMHLAPFWVYKSMGLSDVGIVTMLSIQAVLYISCAALPLPGAIGVGESAFVLYFSSIFTQGSIDTAMLLSRSVGFYFIVVFSAVSLITISLWHKFKLRRERNVVMYAQ